MPGEARRHSYIDVLERVSDGVQVSIVGRQSDSPQRDTAPDRGRKQPAKRTHEKSRKRRLRR